MKGLVKKTAVNAAYIVIVIAAVFGIWAAAAAVIDTELILPDIGATFSALGGLLDNPAFWSALWGTVSRALIGYGISVALFFVLFFLSTAFDGVRRIVSPLMSALRTLPTMAIALVLMVWSPRYTLIVLAVTVLLPQLYSSSVARNATVQGELIEICSICGASRAQRFFSVYLPNAAAGLPESLSSALSFGVKIVVAAEILVQTKNGIGTLMKISEANLMTANLIALTFAAVIVSVILEWIVRLTLSLALKRFKD